MSIDSHYLNVALNLNIVGSTSIIQFVMFSYFSSSVYIKYTVVYLILIDYIIYRVFYLISNVLVKHT